MSLSRAEYEALSPLQKQQFAAKASPKELAEVMANVPVEVQDQRVPFFKSSKLQLLNEEMERLISDGQFTDDDFNKLAQLATHLNLGIEEVNKLRIQYTEKALDPIKERCYRTFHFTDEDQAFVDDLSERYNAVIVLEPTIQMCRDIYLLEVKKTNPLKPIIADDLILDGREQLYLSQPTQWHQLRSVSHGYDSASVGFPAGIRGVRFRVGESIPNRSEEITSLATGALFTTSKRLLFNGDRRNMTVPFTRIIGMKIYSDSLEVKKSTGKSDYFSMNVLEARYLSALITFLKMT